MLWGRRRATWQYLSGTCIQMRARRIQVQQSHQEFGRWCCIPESQKRAASLQRIGSSDLPDSKDARTKPHWFRWLLAGWSVQLGLCVCPETIANPKKYYYLSELVCMSALRCRVWEYCVHTWKRNFFLKHWDVETYCKQGHRVQLSPGLHGWSPSYRGFWWIIRYTCYTVGQLIECQIIHVIYL